MWKQRKQCIWKGLGSGQTWNRSQQKLTKLADEQGSSLSLCAEAFRSCLSAPPNLIKLLKGAHCLDVNTWQFGSVECELPDRCSLLALLFIFAFSAILQIPNIILSSLSQYFCSCLLCIWKLGGMSLYHLVCSGTWVSADLPNVWFLFCFEGLPSRSTFFPPLPAKQLMQLCRLLTGPLEQLNRFILLSVNLASMQTGRKAAFECLALYQSRL